MPRMNVYNLTQPDFTPGFAADPNKWMSPFVTETGHLPPELRDTVQVKGDARGSLRTGYITAIAKYLDAHRVDLAPGDYKLFVANAEGTGRLVDITVPDPQPAAVLSSPGSLA
jgi:hypothetical protein